MSEVTHQLEIYPERRDEIGALYFIEFTKWSHQPNWHWTLFRRSWLCSKEEWEKQMPGMPDWGREVHPWNLGGGELCEDSEVINMNTRDFLTHMVDALNEKAARNDTYKPMITNAMDRIMKKASVPEYPTGAILDNPPIG